MIFGAGGGFYQFGVNEVGQRTAVGVHQTAVDFVGYSTVAIANLHGGVQVGKDAVVNVVGNSVSITVLGTGIQRDGRRLSVGRIGKPDRGRCLGTEGGAQYSAGGRVIGRFVQSRSMHDNVPIVWVGFVAEVSRIGAIEASSSNVNFGSIIRAKIIQVKHTRTGNGAPKSASINVERIGKANGVFKRSSVDEQRAIRDDIRFNVPPAKCASVDHHLVGSLWCVDNRNKSRPKISTVNG